MTTTGKKARKAHGTMAAAKRAKKRKRKTGKVFGMLPYSVLAKTADRFNATS